MSRARRLWCGLCLGILAGGWCASAYGANPPPEADRKLITSVAKRILAEAEPVEGWIWPPEIVVVADDAVNAFASFAPLEGEKKPDDAEITWRMDLPAAEGSTGKQRPRITINQGFLDKIVKGNEDHFAIVFGHEMGHVILRHIEGREPGSMLVAKAITRQQEANADEAGLKLALQAGFSYRGCINGYLAMRAHENYNSFEGLNYSHPGWTDRVASIAAEESKFWEATSAFENGVYFLVNEQHALAQRCFLQVTKDLPNCHDAWANLGYSRLMMYCDGLEAEDLRRFDVGQLVVGGFCRRPPSLEQTRGVDEELWFDAVGALREALRLKPGLVLPKANLAVAYLMCPAGRDVGKAAELFDQVVAALKEGVHDDELDALTHASLLVNAGVAEIANGNAESAEQLFQQAQERFKEVGDVNLSGPVQNAISYNRAQLRLSSGNETERRSAVDELEAYLSRGNPAVAWWPLAYERYSQLCKQQGAEPKPWKSFWKGENTHFRLVTGYTTANGFTVTLNQPVSEVEAALGEGSKLVVVRRVNIHRRRYDEQGLELLCTDHVLAIRLRDDKAGPLQLRVSGLGGETREIRIGMTLAELETALAGDASKFDYRAGTTDTIRYRFFPSLGIGVRLSDDNVVTEMIIAQLPYEKPG